MRKGYRYTSPKRDITWEVVEVSGPMWKMKLIRYSRPESLGHIFPFSSSVFDNWSLDEGLIVQEILDKYSDISN